MKNLNYIVIVFFLITCCFGGGFPKFLNTYYAGSSQVTSPKGLTITDDGFYLYVTNSYGDGITILTTGDMGIQYEVFIDELINTEYEANQIVLTTTENSAHSAYKAYISCFGADENSGSQTNGIIQPLVMGTQNFPSELGTPVQPTPNVDSMALHCTGIIASKLNHYVYFCWYDRRPPLNDWGYVSVIDTNTDQIVYTFEHPSGAVGISQPAGLALSADEQWLYVTDRNLHKLHAFLVTEGGQQIELQNSLVINESSLYRYPSDVTLSCDEVDLWISHNGEKFDDYSPYITIVNVSTFEIDRRIETSNYNPAQIKFLNDCETVVVCNYGVTNGSHGETITFIDSNTYTELRIINPLDDYYPASSQPFGTAVHPNSDSMNPYLYISEYFNNSVSKIQIEAIVPDIKTYTLLIMMLVISLVFKAYKHK